MDKAGGLDGARRHLVVLFTAGLFVAGCGSAATPTPTVTASAPGTPTVTASPSPSPSPTPDIAATALTGLQGLPATGFVADVSGSLASTAGTWPVHGTLVVAGADEQTDVTVTEGATNVETHAVVSQGKAYVAHGSGPYFAGPALTQGFGPTSGSTIGSILGSVASVRLVGAETHAGQSLQHLAATVGVPAAPFAFGFADATISQPELTLAVYADDAGKVVLLGVTGTWQQTIGRTKMALTATIDVTLRDGFAAVTTPAEVWAPFSSKRFAYHAAKGTDWTLSVTNKSYDELATTQDAFIDITSVATRASLTAATNDSISVDTKDLGKKPEANESMRIGGAPARLLTFHGTYDKTKLYVLDAAVVSGGRAYFITYSTLPGTEATDKAVFLDFLGTFAFGA